MICAQLSFWQKKLTLSDVIYLSSVCLSIGWRLLEFFSMTLYYDFMTFKNFCLKLFRKTLLRSFFWGMLRKNWLSLLSCLALNTAEPWTSYQSINEPFRWLNLLACGAKAVLHVNGDCAFVFGSNRLSGDLFEWAYLIRRSRDTGKWVITNVEVFCQQLCSREACSCWTWLDLPY